jgi:hypothetical protein
MNKIIFCTILQSALLCFDGVQETELIEHYGLNPELARVGVKLCSFLKSKQIMEDSQ